MGGQWQRDKERRGERSERKGEKVRKAEVENKGETERGRERQRGGAGCESAVTTECSGSEKFKYKHGRTILTRRGRQSYLHKRLAARHQGEEISTVFSKAERAHTT